MINPNTVPKERAQSVVIVVTQEEGSTGQAEFSQCGGRAEVRTAGVLSIQWMVKRLGQLQQIRRSQGNKLG